MSKVIYNAVVNGSISAVKSIDDQHDVKLGLPVEMGGDGVSGTNPEQLFAAAYIACFSGTATIVAKQKS